MGVPGTAIRKDKARDALNGGSAKEQGEADGEIAWLLLSS